MPRVVDGATLAIGTAKVRLEGIDAPETDQVCLKKKMDAPYKSRPLKAWLKIKNPKAPAATLVVDRTF